MVRAGGIKVVWLFLIAGFERTKSAGAGAGGLGREATLPAGPLLSRLSSWHEETPVGPSKRAIFTHPHDDGSEQSQHKRRAGVRKQVGVDGYVGRGDASVGAVLDRLLPDLSLTSSYRRHDSRARRKHAASSAAFCSAASARTNSLTTVIRLSDTLDDILYDVADKSTTEDSGEGYDRLQSRTYARSSRLQSEEERGQDITGESNDSIFDLSLVSSLVNRAQTQQKKQLNPPPVYSSTRKKERKKTLDEGALVASALLQDAPKFARTTSQLNRVGAPGGTSTVALDSDVQGGRREWRGGLMHAEEEGSQLEIDIEADALDVVHQQVCFRPFPFLLLHTNTHTRKRTIYIYIYIYTYT